MHIIYCSNNLYSKAYITTTVSPNSQSRDGSYACQYLNIFGRNEPSADLALFFTAFVCVVFLLL